MPRRKPWRDKQPVQRLTEEIAEVTARLRARRAATRARILADKSVSRRPIRLQKLIFAEQTTEVNLTL